MSNYFIAVSAIIGTVIGAGILGIPYAIVQSGFIIGVLNLIFVGLIMVTVMLFLGEIALRTRTRHQLSGYAEKYLGKKGKILMFIAVAFGIYSALLAYLIGESESLSFLIFGNGHYSLLLGIGFWLLLSVLSHSGVKAVKKAEPVGIVLVFVLIASIVLVFGKQIDSANLSYYNWENFFVPFGVIMFAYLGYSIIPEIKEILAGEKRLFERVITNAYTIILLVYFIFSLIVVGAKGAGTSEIATVALGRPFILLGIFTMFNAYLALSVALMDNLRFDFGKTKTRAWTYTIIFPLIAFSLLKLLGVASFVMVIGIGGVVTGGLTGILVLAMHRRAKKLGDREPEYSLKSSKFFDAVLILLFVIGAGVEIWNVVF